TSIGCYERTLAYLIEKYAGAFPVWLSPTQAKIITVSENNNDYAREIEAKMSAMGIRVETDLDNESVGKKIRNAVLEKTPYILVLGDKEMADGSVAVRKRGSKDTVSMSFDEFMAQIRSEIDNKTL
ncbi:MAG: threonine--tRNA ligase, partial [Clostridia bacterium]|nr:threonine--tRNA ligase [Clostridia bacterium]